MTRHRRISTVVPALLLAACATGGVGEPDPGMPAPAGAEGPIIEIMNGAYNATDVQILIVSSIGIEVELGRVAAGDTAVFSFNGERGVYGLQAVDTGGSRRRSLTFSVGPRVHVRWDLQTDFLTTRRRRD